MPVTVFGVATALKRTLKRSAMKQSGWEIASHGLKWIEHQYMSIERERPQMEEAMRLHEAAT